MSERDWVDWSIEVTYWVPEGGEDPDIRWPSDWECCGYPACDPRHLRNDVPARGGYTYLNMPMYHVNMPMYHVADLNQELASICTLIESLPGPERTKWDTLEDRHLRFSAGIPEIHAADLLNTGFVLAGPLLQRLHTLSFRISITLQMDGSAIRHCES
ncbi:MAG TPA: hypothetical protein VJ731_11675 [Terriglobales bacterium]|nr:hypothetical protein [Terriglobales bacterium]